MLPTDLANAIRAELADPYYSEWLAARDWARIGLELDGLPRGGRPRQSITREAFLLRCAPAAFRIAELTDNQQRKWDRVLGMIQASPSVDLTDPAVLGMLSQGIADGILTAPEVLAITHEPCTRLMELTGNSGWITNEDIASLFPPVEVVNVPMAP